MSQHRHSSHQHRRTSLLKRARNGVVNAVLFIFSLLEDFFRGKGAKSADELDPELSFEKKQ